MLSSENCAFDKNITHRCINSYPYFSFTSIILTSFVWTAANLDGRTRRTTRSWCTTQYHMNLNDGKRNSGNFFPFVLLLSGPPPSCRKDPTNNTILVYRRRSRRWEETVRLAAHTDNVSSLAISPCGRYLASAAWDGKVS
jgi:WD40 repeat protein